MKIEKINKSLAPEVLDNLAESGFCFSNKDIQPRYIKLREELESAYFEVKKTLQFGTQGAGLRESQNEIKNKKYTLDYMFGIKLFSIMNKYFDLTNNHSLASDTSFWIYINLKIIPDFVYERWGHSSERFYKHNKRIWTLSLWWYVYLTWQGNDVETKKVIQHFSTDVIVSLVERVGKGYDVQLYRTIAKGLRESGRGSMDFRKVMMLNTIYIKTIEPKFFKGSYEGYVRYLFNVAKGD